jgi:hypothetical protein
VVAGVTSIMTAIDVSGARMRLARLVMLLAVVGVGAASLSACVVEHRRDGGVTVRPVH